MTDGKDGPGVDEHRGSLIKCAPELPGFLLDEEVIEVDHDQLLRKQADLRQKKSQAGLVRGTYTSLMQCNCDSSAHSVLAGQDKQIQEAAKVEKKKARKEAKVDEAKLGEASDAPSKPKANKANKSKAKPETEPKVHGNRRCKTLTAASKEDPATEQTGQYAATAEQPPAKKHRKQVKANTTADANAPAADGQGQPVSKKRGRQVQTTADENAATAGGPEQPATKKKRNEPADKTTLDAKKEAASNKRREQAQQALQTLEDITEPMRYFKLPEDPQFKNMFLGLCPKTF